MQDSKRKNQNPFQVLRNLLKPHALLLEPCINIRFAIESTHAFLMDLVCVLLKCKLFLWNVCMFLNINLIPCKLQ